MSGPILCIRPEPGLSQTIERARAEGLEIAPLPLFEIVPVDWHCPPNADFDGVLLGSANAMRHGGEQIGVLRHLPAYTVGDTTAKAAQQKGFRIAGTGQGGLQNLLDGLPRQPLRLLRLAGRDRVTLSPARHHHIEERVVYESRAIPAPDDLSERVANGAIVLLHSALAAEHFGKECNRMRLDRQAIRLAVLGPRIAQAAGEDWAGIASASRPDDAALLALIKNMCK